MRSRLRCAASTPFNVLIVCLATSFLLALAPGAYAEQVVVTMVDGRQIEGELVRETDEQVVLRIAGIEASFSRENVSSIDVRPSMEQFYRERRAELDDDDIDGRYNLTYELYERGALELAMAEVESLLERFPDAERVERLKRVIEHRQRLEAQDPASPRDLEAARERAAALRAEREGTMPRLGERDVNRIRVFEIDLEEEPRIQVPREKLQEFLEEYASEPGVPTSSRERGEFLRAEGHRQLALMFNVQAREFYGDVLVRQDPPALLDFRRNIHNQYVLRYCGTNECHGGDEAPGNLRLLRAAASRTDTIYTNFYILHSYQNENGYMIDRDRPEQSLLVQHGLARDAAQTPHPDVTGWRPRFRDTSDRFFVRYVDFIESLWRPTPDYGIDYHPPGMPVEQEQENGEADQDAQQDDDA